MIEPLSFYKSTNNLKFYLINCDSGLTHLIVFPDGTVMLFDCNLTDENKDRILNFMERVIPKKDDKQEIDIFVNSHRDTDHLRGLKHINARFKIKSIWDSGQYGASTDNTDYKYYMYLKRALKNESEQNVKVLVPTNIEIASYGCADIYCMSAEADFEENYVQESSTFAKKQHTNSIVLLIEYVGRKMLLTGDSDWKCWKEYIVPEFSVYEHNYEDVDILIASHHGSRSFFTDESNKHIDIEENPDTTYVESIELIKPKITLISCGKYETYHHPNKDAVALYKKWTSEEQVYTTNDCGTFCGIIDQSGDFAVVPKRFYNSSKVHGANFFIVCEKEDDNVAIHSGEEVQVGCNLKFSVIGTGDVINNKDDVKVFWEVANAGIGEHDSHHEIYYKSKNEDDGKFCFSRELCYKGTHLLRCRVKNKTKKFDKTKVFIVHGIDE